MELTWKLRFAYIIYKLVVFLNLTTILALQCSHSLLFIICVRCCRLLLFTLSKSLFLCYEERLDL